MVGGLCERRVAWLGAFATPEAAALARARANRAEEARAEEARDEQARWEQADEGLRGPLFTPQRPLFTPEQRRA